MVTCMAAFGDAGGGGGVHECCGQSGATPTILRRACDLSYLPGTTGSTLYTVVPSESF
jgi:hypothetical protein